MADLKQKYQALLELGQKLPLSNPEIWEEGGKLKIRGTVPYQMEKNLFWDKVKAYADWQTDLVADIKVQFVDIMGIYTVVSGDTLSKIAKEFLGSPGKYMEIYNINRDQLTDPNKIKVGQMLKIPNPPVK